MNLGGKVAGGGGEEAGESVGQVPLGNAVAGEDLGDAEAAESVGVVGLIEPVGDDERGDAVAEGFGAGADTALVNDGGRAGEDAIERRVVEGEGGGGEVGRGGIVAGEKDGAASEALGDAGGGRVEIAGDVDDGGAEGEDDGRGTGGAESVQAVGDVLGDGLIEVGEAGLPGLGGPVGLRGGEELREEGEREVGGVFRVENGAGRRGVPEFAAEGGERSAPAAGDVATEEEDESVGPVAEVAEGMEPGEGGEDAGVVGGEEGGGGEDGVGPRDAALGGDERGDVEEFADEEEIGVGGGGKEIGVGGPDVGENLLAHHPLGAAGGVEEAFDEGGIEFEIGADRAKVESETQNVVLEDAGGRDDRVMTASGGTAGEREERVKVAQRTKGGEHDAHEPLNPEGVARNGRAICGEESAWQRALSYFSLPARSANFLAASAVKAGLSSGIAMRRIVRRMVKMPSFLAFSLTTLPSASI